MPLVRDSVQFCSRFHQTLQLYSSMVELFGGSPALIHLSTGLYEYSFQQGGPAEGGGVHRHAFVSRIQGLPELKSPDDFPYCLCQVPCQDVHRARSFAILAGYCHQQEDPALARSKERLVCLFMTDNFSECSLSVIVENKPTLCSPLTLSAFKNGISVPLFKTLHPNNDLRSYTQSDETVRLAMNYDFPFDKTIQNVVTLLQAHTSACVDTEKVKKLVFLTRQLELLLQKQFSMNDYCSLHLLTRTSGMAENNRDCKATSMLCVMMKSLHKGPSLMISVKLTLTVPRFPSSGKCSIEWTPQPRERPAEEGSPSSDLCKESPVG
ncbi:hypothetical protein FHG87_025005 [Trinorchestia longiramus]|nr:hypothetical protein FHG87_025005 [Trinorchestia longiramus]